MFLAASNRTPEWSSLKEVPQIQLSLEADGMGMNSGKRELTILQSRWSLLNEAARQLERGPYCSRYPSPCKAIRKTRGGSKCLWPCTRGSRPRAEGLSRLLLSPFCWRLLPQSCAAHSPLAIREGARARNWLDPYDGSEEWWLMIWIQPHFLSKQILGSNSREKWVRSGFWISTESRALGGYNV